MLRIHLKVQYNLLINKREGASLKHLNYSKAFIKHSNDFDDTFQIEKRKIIVFYDMIAYYVSLVFITQSYFDIQKKYQTKF